MNISSVYEFPLVMELGRFMLNDNTWESLLVK